ncbi:MAG TPA: hypothetical protein VKF17_06865 [Isosphaeraceae bacterium]|nr:hypothetical protein [Isosphaeraceae bacterium]
MGQTLLAQVSGIRHPRQASHPRRMGANGTPPSARRMWHDPAAHACDFAQRYAEPLDYAVSQRMIELSIDPNRTGMPDIDAGIRHAAFHGATPGFSLRLSILVSLVFRTRSSPGGEAVNRRTCYHISEILLNGSID